MKHCVTRLTLIQLTDVMNRQFVVPQAVSYGNSASHFLTSQTISSDKAFQSFFPLLHTSPSEMS